MKIKEKDIEKIVNFGALGYGAEKMAILLELEDSLVKKEFDNEKSQFYKLYKKGEYLNQYIIDVKLMEMARAGDMKAMDKLAAKKNPNNKNYKR